jgi:drug/metabolite transporter (DMT)-like permease
MPFWVLIFAWPMLHERIQGLQWLSVALAIVGLVFVLEPWNAYVAVQQDALALIAGMCWAIGVVYAKRLHNRVKVEPWRSLSGK